MPAGRVRFTPVKRRTSWIDAVKIDWTTAFPPPADPGAGYAKRIGSVDDAVKKSVGDGGWNRAKRPTIVLLYDSSSKKHLAALATLESEVRFKVASYIFNCFRVDVRGLPGKPDGKVAIRAYSRDGDFVGEKSGLKRIPNAFKLIDGVFAADYGKASLGKAANWLQGVLSNRAYTDHLLEHHGKTIQCEHCGGCNPGTVAMIHKLKARRAQYDEAIEKFVARFGE